MKKQLGFTMIELVLVIVILGILAAFAIPRFVNLGKDARAATVKALEGNLRSAAALAKATSLAQGRGPTEAITMEGSPVQMVFHYPAALNGIEDALAGIEGFTPTMEGDPPIAILFAAQGAADASNCRVRYREAESATIPPFIRSIISDC